MGRLIEKTRKHQKKSLVKGGKKKRGGSKKVIQKKKRVSRKGRMLGGDNTPLHQACRDGNLEVALDLIEKGAPINARNSKQRTPLHLAIRNGHLEIVKALITAKANVNIKADYKTSLDFAFQSENLEIVNALIEHRADVNEGDILGNTYLHHGVMDGRTEKVKLIIKAGANINAINDSRYTPLHYAGMYGGLEITKELIKAGADINARNIEEETPLHFAVAEDNLEVAEELIKAGADVNAKDNHGNTPLHHRRFAAELFHTHDIAETLIKNGADINIRNNEGEIPALPAAMTELFNRLWRGTPLLTAMHSNDMGAFQTLLNDYTYDVNEKLTGGWTILHVAAFGRSIYTHRMDYVDLLLKSGRVDVDAKTNDGKTALMIATERGDVELVKRLGVSKKQR